MAEARELERHHQPHIRVLHRLADAGGVRQHDVTLQRHQVFRADMHAREFAEAGIDPVDRRAARDDGVDRPGARFDRRERRRIEADARAVGNRAPVGKRCASRRQRDHAPLRTRAWSGLNPMR